MSTLELAQVASRSGKPARRPLVIVKQPHNTAQQRAQYAREQASGEEADSDSKRVTRVQAALSQLRGLTAGAQWSPVAALALAAFLCGAGAATAIAGLRGTEQVTQLANDYRESLELVQSLQSQLLAARTAKAAAEPNVTLSNVQLPSPQVVPAPANAARAAQAATAPTRNGNGNGATPPQPARQDGKGSASQQQARSNAPQQPAQQAQQQAQQRANVPQQQQPQQQQQARANAPKVQGPAAGGTSPAGTPGNAEVAHVVTPDALNAARKTNRIEGVGANQLGVSKLGPNGVQLKNGNAIRVGDVFPSGERLLGIDVDNGQLVTDRRTILVL